MSETNAQDLLVDWGERSSRISDETTNHNTPEIDSHTEKLVRRWGIRRPNRSSSSSHSEDKNKDEDHGAHVKDIGMSERRDEYSLKSSGERHVDDESDDDISYGAGSSQDEASTCSEEGGEMDRIIPKVDTSTMSDVADETSCMKRGWNRRSLSPLKATKGDERLLANDALLEENKDDDVSFQRSLDIDTSKEEKTNYSDKRPQLLLREFNHDPNMILESSSILACSKPMEGFGGGEEAMNATRKFNLGSLLESFQKRRLRAQAELDPEKVSKQALQKLENDVRANSETMTSMDIGTETKKGGWTISLRRNLKNAALAPETFVDKMLDEPDGDENLGWYGSVPTDGDEDFDVDSNMRSMKLDGDEPDWNDDYMLDECLGIDGIDEYEEEKKGYYGCLTTEGSDDENQAAEDEDKASKEKNKSSDHGDGRESKSKEHLQEIIQALESTVKSLQAELRLKAEEVLTDKKTISALQEEIKGLRYNGNDEGNKTSTVDLLDQPGTNLDEDKNHISDDIILEKDILNIGSIEGNEVKNAPIVEIGNKGSDGGKHFGESLLDLKATVIVDEDPNAEDDLLQLGQ